MTMMSSLPWVMTTTLDLGKGAAQGKVAIFLAMAVKWREEIELIGIENFKKSKPKNSWN